jgi:hypothetical protein
MVGGNVQPLWQSGGAVDLSGSSNPRAVELERRIVLSQYLTAINGAGRTPPQETGLVCNSWHGKFHLEMHWWHAAHFLKRNLSGGSCFPDTTSLRECTTQHRGVLVSGLLHTDLLSHTGHRRCCHLRQSLFRA